MISEKNFCRQIDENLQVDLQILCNNLTTFHGDVMPTSLWTSVHLLPTRNGMFGMWFCFISSISPAAAPAQVSLRAAQSFNFQNPFLPHLPEPLPLCEFLSCPAPSSGDPSSPGWPLASFPGGDLHGEEDGENERASENFFVRFDVLEIPWWRNTKFFCF